MAEQYQRKLVAVHNELVAKVNQATVAAVCAQNMVLARDRELAQTRAALAAAQAQNVALKADVQRLKRRGGLRERKVSTHDASRSTIHKRTNETVDELMAIHVNHEGFIDGLFDIFERYSKELIPRLLESPALQKGVRESINRDVYRFETQSQLPAIKALLARLRQKLGRQRLQRLAEAATKIYNTDTSRFIPQTIETGVGLLRVARMFGSATRTLALKKQIIESGVLTPVVSLADEMSDPSVNGARRPLKDLLINTIKVIQSRKDLCDMITWFVDEDNNPRERVWMVATAGDGFPRTKHTGAMEMVMQLRNMGPITHLVDWAPTVFGFDGSESGAITAHCLKILNREMEEVERDGLMIPNADGVEELHRFRFVFKADQKFWNHCGCACTYPSPFYDFHGEIKGVKASAGLPARDSVPSNARTMGATFGGADNENVDFRFWDYAKLVAASADVDAQVQAWRAEHPNWSDAKLRDMSRLYAT